MIPVLPPTKPTQKSSYKYGFNNAVTYVTV